MKPSSLHALVIDRHFGELSPEAIELLDLHLAQDEAARAEAERIVQSLGVTQEAVLRHPELGRVVPEVKTAPPAVRRVTLMPWLARAAAVGLLAGLAGAGGFVAGRSQSAAQFHNATTAPSLAMTQAKPRRQSPWAQYRMTFDPAGDGVQVIRVDTSH